MVGQSRFPSDPAHLFPPSLQKFLFFVLKSSDVLDILVPILYFLNDARADHCKAGVGVRSWGLPCRGAGPANLRGLPGAQAQGSDLPGRASSSAPEMGPCPALLTPVPTLCGDFSRNPCCSSGWPDAHWSLHLVASERGAELWGEAEQALLGARAHGHPCLHRYPCRPAHCGEGAALARTGGMGDVLLAASGGGGDPMATLLPPRTGIPQDHHQRSPAPAAPL